LASGAVSLDLYDNPARTSPVQLASAPIVGTVPGFTFDLYGIALGNRIRCGTTSAVPPVEVSVTDSFYPTGSWGIRALEASATFDSVRAYSPPP
jgi:hypothetical protein